jgi:hypothetical protein
LELTLADQNGGGERGGGNFIGDEVEEGFKVVLV